MTEKADQSMIESHCFTFFKYIANSPEAHRLPISAMVSGILVQCILALSVGLDPGRCPVAALIDIS